MKLRGGALVFVVAAMAAPSTLVAHPDTPRRLEEVARELEARPGAPDLLYRRGCLLLDEEYANYPQALRDLTAALAAPGITDARLFRATALLRLGDHARALADLDAYIRAAPEDVRGYEGRFEARLAAGRKRDALADLRSALHIQPRADLYSRLAGLQHEDGDPSGAIATYEEGIARLGRPVELMVALVDTAVRSRVTAKALEWLAVLEAEGGRRERWRLVRAEVLEQAGRAAEARAAYQEVLGLHEARAAAGGFLSQPMRLEQAQALAGLGRKEDARALVATLPETVKGRAEYQRLMERLAR
jgi:tetratricopeptide (TPR) repeat protein